ncbi:hypothetical protein KY339_05005, partial [Candidatus Woesearchaeota archaeon]|nr:hypothetical protein [Candidatus Woesearchaeota archaeon]
RFIAYIEYVGHPTTYAWSFEVKANEVANVVMSEMYRDFNPLEIIGREVSRVIVTAADCSIGEYSFGRTDIK